MNRCSISEEETTNALRARYQVQASVAPLVVASGSQLDQHAHPGRTVLGVSPGGDAGRYVKEKEKKILLDSNSDEGINLSGQYSFF